MGKSLIIKGADFSANAIMIGYYIPKTVINATASSFFVNQSTSALIDDVNELSGKTITGFDLLFVNKCGGQAMGETITFNPGTEQEIVCNVNCAFETQNESEQKTIHYDLSEPYTFKENDVLHILPTGATYTDSSGNVRGGCSVARVARPDSIPNFAFLAKVGNEFIQTSSYQPFMKLYLQ